MCVCILRVHFVVSINNEVIPIHSLISIKYGGTRRQHRKKSYWGDEIRHRYIINRLYILCRGRRRSRHGLMVYSIVVNSATRDDRCRCASLGYSAAAVASAAVYIPT